MAQINAKVIAQDKSAIMKYTINIKSNQYYDNLKNIITSHKIIAAGIQNVRWQSKQNSQTAAQAIAKHPMQYPIITKENITHIIIAP